MKVSHLLPAGLLLLTLGCASADTCASYVDGLAGYSVTPGEITRIENLDARQLDNLADGVVITLAEAGRVTLRFNKKESKVFEVAAGSLLVVGKDKDYVLQSHRQSESK